MTLMALKKVTICGLHKEKEPILKGLQDLGCMHLVPLRPAPAEPERAASPRAEDTYKALRFLTDMKDRRKQLRRDPKFDIHEVTESALDVQYRLRQVTDRRDFLQQRIKDVEPWGDLEFPPHEELAGYRLWFYVLPAGKRRVLETIDLPWQIVRKDQRKAYVVLIAEDEPPSDLLPVPRTHTGALPLGELKLQLEETEAEIESLVAERQALTRYIHLMSANLALAEDDAARAYASEQTLDSEGIVAVQGWAPVDTAAELRKLCEQHDLACLIEEPDPDDDPPTLLENPPALGAATGLAMFYQVPGYRSWDPGLVVYFSFALFFAMIISDAGYALVLLALVGCYWGKLSANPSGRSFRNLALLLLGTSVVWGVLAGGYFGVTPSDGSFLGWFHVIDLNNFDFMMKLSIIIGVLHIMLANGIMAHINWHQRSIAFPKLGWNGGALGGLTMWLSGGEGFFGVLGWLLLLGGLAVVFWFSSERRFDNPKDAILRVVDGLRALTGVSGIFGDILSYMRLFALGLASASLALTFNQLAVQVEEAVPGLGMLIAILILLLGHVMNLGLAIMSGVVHGLRLNFIEFYKWGMSGEGYPFKAFARKEVQ